MAGLSENPLEELFHSLTELPAAERTLALEQLKQQDPARAEQILALLAADDSNRDGLFGSSPADDHTGDQLEETPLSVGQYEIRHLVGRGGMGSVYAALHPGTGRQCALKLLHPGFATRQNLQRFYREATFLASLDHTGIARVYDAGSAEAVYASGDRTQRPFIAMEFITGVDIMTRVRTTGATLVQSAELVAQAADALHHAHECGIIHRDIKPGNILVDDTEAVKVVDFGIARLDGGQDLTTSLAPGTAAYMSPEQMAGMRDRVDTRTDVYALGATLYALVTGRKPSLHMAESSIDGPWDGPWLTGKPDRRLAAILRKAMAWVPEHRYRSAAEFAEELRCWVAGKPILARPERLDWLRRLRRSHPRTVYAVAAAVLLVAVVASEPDWRLYLRARLLPASTHTVVLLNFTTPADPTGTSPVPTQFNQWAAQELQAGGLLKPLPQGAGLHEVLPQGSSTLLSQSEIAKLRKLGADYALVGDYDLSGDQPWATLKIQARLIDITGQRTAEVISVQGSLAEAQALVTEVCLQLTQSQGKREQFLRLQHASHPESDRLYADAVALFAKHDLIKARTLLEQALDRNYANTAARLALVRVLDALGYRDPARKHAALAADFATSDFERVDAQALAVELEGRPEEGLRLRDSVAMPSAQSDRWMAEASRVKDLIALDQKDRAEKEIAADTSEPGVTAAERLIWMNLHIDLVRLLKGRPGYLAEGKALLARARRDGSPTMVADAYIQESEGYATAGKADESIADLQQAKDLYSSQGDREGRARAMLSLGQRIQVHGRTGDAIAILSDAMREVSGAGFVAVEQQIDQLLGSAYGRGYDPELSRQMLSRALVLSWSQPDQYLTRQVLQRLGITLTEEGNLPEARKIFQSALPAHIERNEAAARTYNALGEADLLAGDASAALADAAQGAALGSGAPDVASDALLLRTRALALQGDYSGVEPNFRKAVELATRRELPGSIANEQFQWGECLLESGSAAAAVPHLQAAVSKFAEIDRPADQAAAEALLATAFIELHNVASAKASLARAAAISSVYKFAYPRIVFELAQAQVAAAQGHREEARQLYHSAHDDASHVGFTRQVKAAELALQKLNQP